MPNMVKNIFKYIIIFFSILIVAFSALVLTATIPKNKIKNNIQKSSKYLCQKREINYIRRKHPCTYLHIYADEMILNIIYTMDETTPIKSSMEAKYSRTTLDKITNSEEEFEKNEYMRYWHGSIVFIKPLLLIFSIQQIYIINILILSILTIMLIFALWRKKCKFTIFTIIIAYIMTGTIFVPLCLEYTWNYIIMLIVSIVAIKIEYRGNSKLYILFFISGILTCFFDFLSTEILTILVPLILVLNVRYENKNSIKENILFIIWSIIIWTIGYSIMWEAKWILSMSILEIHDFSYIFDKLLVRVNSERDNMTWGEMAIKALEYNIFSLYPLDLIKIKRRTFSVLAIMFFTISVIFILWRKKKLKKFIPFIIISIIPYIRYLILANHSYVHYFFTFRIQFPVIMCLLFAIKECIDLKFMLLTQKYELNNLGKNKKDFNKI